ncbi:MAG: hypothetical protein J5367_06675 [Lachnospiraceae bacterium]|nr:hypothetical protein [Lachnospiraceae bacterium]
MELINELKNKVDKAETKDEAKEIIAEAGMLLDDEELDQVAGGLQKQKRLYSGPNQGILA